MNMNYTDYLNLTQNLGYADLERDDLKVLREIADQRNSSTSDSDSDSSEVAAEVKPKNTKLKKSLITEMTWIWNYAGFKTILVCKE